MPKKNTKNTTANRAAKRIKKSRAAFSDIDSRSILLEAASKVGDNEVRGVLRDAKKIEDKSRSGPLAEFFADIKDLLAMVRDYANGRYREIPFGSIAAVVGALLYVLSPIDLIPDFIPAFGYVDDAAVVAACIRLVRVDLENYRNRRSARAHEHDSG
jgi:uncharacterized membrane protein YkvA (DUF1232 family)